MYGLIIQAVTWSYIYLLFCVVTVLKTMSFSNLPDYSDQKRSEIACAECLDKINTEL